MVCFVKEIWSVSQCLQTLDEASVMLFTYGFRKFIHNVNVLTFERKISTKFPQFFNEFSV